MITRILPALFAAVSTAAIAQPAPPPVQLPSYVAALRDAALKDDLAWDITEGLTTEVGQRLAGTEAEARARAWAVAKLRSLGFANVRIETFDMPVWVRGAESATIVSPFPQKLVLAALGNSGATPPEGIEAEVVSFDSLDALRAAPDALVRGKIVFVSHAMPRTQDGSGYGEFGAPRRQGPSIASRKGAAAIVIRSIGTDYHRNPHTGVQRFEDGVAPIPAAALSLPDAEQLQRIIKRANGQPVRMRLVLTPRNIGTRQSGNVIAEVPGRDPSLPPILVGGHLDSWDLGTGAIDDASGVAITTAAAKRIMDAGRPLRTIRIVWFGAEEVGLYGGIDYMKRYGGKPHYAVAESDFGADRVWRVKTRLGDARKAEAAALRRALLPLGIVPGAEDEGEGSDITPLVEAGQPVVELSQDGTHYFDLHHTPDDTLDKINPEALRQNVAAWTTMLAVLSGGLEPIRRPRR
ncbi:M28 family peptidase [Sphingomonas sinipercae]|uniref:Carboxypeptidase Q n=1 Tax=Sphingomonas sinipercae TaxID=2714944 RepID=A0A6G7ZN36_9SPHN|nr:M28 family peptidase [Sphingomonas sinipercae]QIL02391.1 M28 family peptidase [Sphingomonas sinipercae]